MITAGIVLRSADRVWLVKDSHGNWGIPKGKQDAGDYSIAYTAIREAREELNVALGEVRLLSIGHTLSGRPLHVYCADAQSTPVINDRKEIRKLKAVKLTKALKMIHKGQRKALKALKG